MYTDFNMFMLKLQFKNYGGNKMINLGEFLNSSVGGVFTTVCDNKPYTRVFQVLWYEDNKLFFCTGGKKEVYEQLLNNPNVSFCVENKYNPVLSINGNAIFIDDISYKEKAFKELPMLESIYSSPSNEVFKLFYINITEIKTFSFNEGTKVYKV